MVYYRFLGLGKETTFTLTSPVINDLEFNIVQFNEGEDRIEHYSTAADSQAVRTKWVGAGGPILKAKMYTQLNQEYFLEVYTPEDAKSDTGRLGEYYYLYVGEPLLWQGSATFFATNSGTGTPNAFSQPVTIMATGDLPNTAEVENVLMKTATSGIRVSDLKFWRVRNTNDITWKVSPQTIGSFDVPYTPLATGNSKLRPSWQFSFQCANSYSSLTFRPGITFTYFYEFGDWGIN